jgi:hypothetical protein
LRSWLISLEKETGTIMLKRTFLLFTLFLGTFCALQCADKEDSQTATPAAPDEIAVIPTPATEDPAATLFAPPLSDDKTAKQDQSTTTPIEVKAPNAGQIEASASTPRRSVSAEAKDVLAQIDYTEDFVELHDLQQNYLHGKQHSTLLDQAFANKWEALTADMKPKTLVPGLAFLAVDTRATSEGEHTFSFLLKSTEDMHADYHLGIVAKVDPVHAQLLPDNERHLGHRAWAIIIRERPTSTWKAGQYHVLERRSSAAVIPYEIHIVLEKRDLTIPGTKYLGFQGNHLNLGWHVGHVR